MQHFGSDLLELVGNTPLLRLKKYCPAGNLFAKAEWYNPGRSVKDRAAYNMISEALKSGELVPGKIIMDATSGNTGIAYAMIGAALDYRVKLCMPSNVTPSRQKIIKFYGAELILTDPQKSSDGAIEKSLKLYEKNPEIYYFPNQYCNDNNWKAHFKSTGPEIYQQTKGQVTHFLAGLGTSGTFMGTSRYLKTQNSAIQVIEVQPDSPFHGLEGMKHMESSIVPAFYDENFADRKMTVRTEDAYRSVKRLAREEGILVGISCGAALDAAYRVAMENPEHVVVTIFPDNGDKYLEERFWEDY
ncbi:MAG: PLP-dependent cysteine synthase family protein [SAR324 cluster bacterium]|nr:PLP-dependent cysteine synthase family protein [SAR324 cluster bacterium]